MFRIQKKSLSSCEFLTKGHYVLWQNNKICIVNQYGQIKWYWRDIKSCFAMIIYGCLSIIGFPVILIYTLYSFIPAIYIKDPSIDKKKQREKDKANKEMGKTLHQGDEKTHEQKWNHEK